MKFSKMIIGNSSSAIIESPSFNIPVLNIGSRQNGREFSKNILSCEINKAIIENKIKKLSSFKKKKLKQLNLNYKKNSLLNTSNKILNLVKKQKEFKYFYDNKK